MAAEASRSLIDGVPGESVPVMDRGFSYGDGVFRTVRVDAGHPWLWSDHMNTLLRDCSRMGIPVDDGLPTTLRAELETLAGAASGVFKVVVTRGSGPRGDRPPTAPSPRRVTLFQPGDPTSSEAFPRSVRLCKVRMPSLPELAGVKHLNRLPQVLARAEWTGPLPHEGLLRDADDALICGTMSNVFIRIDQRLLTPRLDRCGVAGVVRGRLLDASLPTFARMGLEVSEARLGVTDLLAADEAWLTNAVITLWPIASLVDEDGRPLASWADAPGPAARSLFADLQALRETG
ncbi:MAG: aminodeoxychorismate lyase [Gammaproteobacteria bacterium]|nr:MAG: aminodeoxychorismate lyase [Gammaproteobacteria bacterium]